jgi:hypothetical protein
MPRKRRSGRRLIIEYVVVASLLTAFAVACNDTIIWAAIAFVWASFPYLLYLVAVRPPDAPSTHSEPTTRPFC